MANTILLPTPKKLENGYYLRRHKFRSDYSPTVVFVEDGKVDRLWQYAETSSVFDYTKVYVYTGRQIDELLLEAYMMGADDKAFDPVLLMTAREDNTDGHRQEGV